MEIRIRETGQVVSESKFKAMHLISTSGSIPPDFINALGADPVLEGAQPTPGQYQSVVRADPAVVQDSNLNWVKAWALRNWTQEEIDTHIAAEAARNQNEIANYLNTVRELRERILNRLAGIGMAAIVEGNESVKSAVVAARQSLLDITSRAEVLAATTAAEAKSAIKAAYAEIVTAAPISLHNAFDEVDT